MSGLRRLLCALAVLAACPGGAAVLAQTFPTYRVSVTESYDLVEDVGTTRRLGRAEIEAANARSLDEALRLMPGVYVRTGGDGTPRIDVRGFRSRHVLLLVDGVLINSTADGQFDPARISTEGIREIKISYGSSSVLYGDNAMAAVVEITTVDAASDAALSLRLGTPEQRGAGGRVSQSVGRLAIDASASGDDTGAFRLPGSFPATTTEDGGRRENSDRTRGDVRAHVAYTLAPWATVGTAWSYATGRYGLPPGTITDPADVFAPAVRYERIERYSAASGQVSLRLTPWRRASLHAWGFRNAQRERRARYDDSTYTSMDDPLVPGTFQSRERTLVTGSTALGRVDLRRAGSLRLSVNQRRERFDAHTTIRDVPSGGTGGGGSGGGGGGGRGGGTPAVFDVRSVTLNRAVDVVSAGSEWQFRPAPRLGAVIGGALIWQARPEAGAEAHPTWIAGVAYDATSSLRLHASGSRKVRMPSIDQLYSAAAGNPALRAERAYGVDAGATQRLGTSTTAGVSAFVTHAHDFIERDAGSPFENHARYRFAGGEVTVETGAIPRVHVKGAYSLLEALDRTPGQGGRPLQTRPRHRAGAAWAWRVAPGTSVRGAIAHVGRQVFDSRGAGTVQRRAPGWTLVDLGVTRTLTDGYDLAVDVSNLFDARYEQAYGLPREGRALVVTLRGRVK